MLDHMKSRITGRRLQILFIMLFTASFTYTIIAQEMGSLKKGIKISFPEKIHKLVLDPLPAGTYSVGTGGYFATIDSAFNKLSIDGVSGEVILELIDNLYTAPTNDYGFFLNGPIPGAGPDSRVTIKPADNKNVTIEGNGFATVTLLNTNYLTIDGVALTGSTTLTIHTLSNNAYGCNDGIDFLNNSDHNVIQNIVFINEDVTRTSGSGFWCPSAGTTVAPDSNLIQNNFVKQGGIALYFSGGNSTVKAKDNIMRGNQIGSETDSLVSWGIQIEHGLNTIVENNVVQNIRPFNDPAIFYYAIGINSYWGDSDIIRNNVVRNIFTSAAPGGSMGILLSGSSPAGQSGSDNQIYNNMIYDIKSTSIQSQSRVAGIQMWAQGNPKIYYNSVYLSGNGANILGSAALYIFATFGATSNIDAKNNIFINTRNESTHCASSIYDYSPSNLTSDYNDLYYEPNQNNCLVRIGGNDYQTLADWQATGQDINSITEMPFFIGPYLHIDEFVSTFLESGATPIAGIDTDFDGELRNVSTPDIGADEFNGLAMENWQTQNSNFPAGYMVSNFAPVSDLVCWAGGLTIQGQFPYPGYIRTTDGGNTWVCDSIPSIPLGLISQVFAIDADTAYMAVYVLTYSNDKGIYKTTNGGTTWTKQNVYLTSIFGAGCIYFFDANNGVAIGDPLLESYTTTNGGQTWNPVSLPLALPDEYTWVGGTCIAGYGNSVWFCSTKRIFHSTDRGYTWTASPNDPQYDFWVPCVAFQDENTGIYSRRNNLAHIYQKTTDGGATWNDLSDPVLDNLTPTCIIHIPGTPATYLVSGGEAAGMRGSAVTSDAGENWVLIDTTGCWSIGFSSVESGWGNPYPTYQVHKYIGPPLPVPVELTTFFATTNGKEVMLNWTTATEINNRGFAIERQVSSKQYAVSSRWEEIGFVPGFGTTTESKSYSYSDKSVKSGTYYYRLKQIDYDGSYEYSDVVEIDLRSFSYLLEQNYPNPFNPTTTIGFGIQNKSNVKITVLNVIGEEVAVVLNEERQPGYYQIEFNAAGLSSGVYFYRIKAENFIQTKKMILLR